MKQYFQQRKRTINTKTCFYVCWLLAMALIFTSFSPILFKVQTIQGAPHGEVASNMSRQKTGIQNVDGIWSKNFETQIYTNFSEINDQGQKRLIPLIATLPNGDIVLLTQDKMLHCFGKDGSLTWKRQLSFAMPKIINSILDLLHKIIFNVVQLLFPYYDFQKNETLQEKDFVLHVFEDGNMLIGSNYSIISIGGNGSFKWKKRESGLIYSPDYSLALLLNKKDEYTFLKAINSKGKVAWNILQEGNLKRIWKADDCLYAYFHHEADGFLYCINRDFKIHQLFSGKDLAGSYNYRNILFENGKITYNNYIHFLDYFFHIKNVFQYKFFKNLSQQFITNYRQNNPNYRHDIDKTAIMFSDLDHNLIWLYTDFFVDEFIEDIRLLPQNEQLTVLTQYIDQDSLIKTRIFALDLNAKLLWEEIFLNDGLVDFQFHNYGQGLIIHSFDEKENLYFILQTQKDGLIEHELIGLSPDGDLLLSKKLESNLVTKSQLGTSAHIIANKKHGHIVIASTDNKEIFFNQITVFYDKGE